MAVGHACSLAGFTEIVKLTEDRPYKTSSCLAEYNGNNGSAYPVEFWCHSQMILITAKATVSEQNRVSYLKVRTAQVENSREEEACLDYGFYEDAMAHGRFIFIERWKDQAALDFHFKQRYCRDFIRSVRRLSVSASPIEIHYVSETLQP